MARRDINAAGLALVKSYESFTPCSRSPRSYPSTKRGSTRDRSGGGNHMLGITVADSVLVGTLILVVLAAWQGKKDGAAAIRELTESIREGNDSKEVHAIREPLEKLMRPR